MRWLRLSIAQVMVVVLYSAIGFSAFRMAGDSAYGEMLTNVFFMLTAGILVIATLITFFREGRTRAHWLGFALFGWLHYVTAGPMRAAPQSTLL